MSLTMDAPMTATRAAPRNPARNQARSGSRGPAGSGKRAFPPFSWLKRRFRARPGTTIAHGVFVFAGLAILVNAVAWQSGPRPQSAPPAAQAATPPVPPQRPADLAATPDMRRQSVQQTASAPASPPPAAAQAPRQGASGRDAAPRDGARDQIGDLIRTGMVPGMDAPRPPAPVIERASLTTGSDRPVLAAQRALNKVGAGPVRADGRFGEETRAAIERFEREQRIPVTRDLSPRTLRALAAASGMRME